MQVQLHLLVRRRDPGFVEDLLYLPDAEVGDSDGLGESSVHLAFHRPPDGHQVRADVQDDLPVVAEGKLVLPGVLEAEGSVDEVDVHVVELEGFQGAFQVFFDAFGVEAVDWELRDDEQFFS